MLYKKVYTGDTTYDVVLVYDDGREQTVSVTQDLYQDWLSQGNTPTEVPYSAPEEDLPSTETLRGLVLRKITDDRDDVLNGGMTYGEYEVATDEFARELIVGGRRMAEDAADADAFEAMVWLADGSVTTFTGTELIDLCKEVDAWAKALYEASVADVATALEADDDALHQFLDEGTWPATGATGGTGATG